MIKPGVAEKIKEFTRNGGIFITTYFSRIVNENDLCFMGGFPGPLREILGIWAEEIECLTDEEAKKIIIEKDNEPDSAKNYEAKIYCDLIHAETAKVLARYGEDFYCGRPALTENTFGKGKAYYIAFRNEDDFYDVIVKKSNIKRTIDTDLPEGVSVMARTDGKSDFVFIMNFENQEKSFRLDEKEYFDMLAEEKVKDVITMSGYDVKILKRLHK